MACLVPRTLFQSRVRVEQGQGPFCLGHRSAAAWAHQWSKGLSWGTGESIDRGDDPGFCCLEVMTAVVEEGGYQQQLTGSTAWLWEKQQPTQNLVFSNEIGDTKEKRTSWAINLTTWCKMLATSSWFVAGGTDCFEQRESEEQGRTKKVAACMTVTPIGLTFSR